MLQLCKKLIEFMITDCHKKATRGMDFAICSGLPALLHMLCPEIFLLLEL